MKFEIKAMAMFSVVEIFFTLEIQVIASIDFDLFLGCYDGKIRRIEKREILSFWGLGFLREIRIFEV